MLRHVRSNAVAYAALFVALGGSSYAALRLPANSVGTKQLRSGAVSSSKVKDRSLLGRDFKRGQLPAGRRGQTGAAGPAGPQGATGGRGPQGNPGTARAYALVTPNGTFVNGVPHPGFSSVQQAPTYTGYYCLTPTAGITPAQFPAVVSSDWGNSDDFYTVAIYRDRSRGGGVCSGADYEVATYKLAGGVPASANEAFSIIVP